LVKQIGAGDRPQRRVRYQIGAGEIGLRKREGDGEFVTAKAGDDRRLAERLVQRARDLPQEPVAHVITMLVVDRLEPVDLDRNDDQFFPASAGGLRHRVGVVGKALAVVKTGRGIGARKYGSPALAVSAQLGLMLEVDVAAPSEENQRDVEG